MQGDEYLSVTGSQCEPLDGSLTLSERDELEMLRNYVS